MNDAVHRQRIHPALAGGGARRIAGAMLMLAPLALLVAGCRAPPAAHTQVVATAAPAGTTPFRLDADASQVWIFLHADGPLATMGHTHVISSRALRGTIWLHPDPGHSACDFQLPVAQFVVDDPQERTAAGGEFAEPLDEAARAGTREHMLGDRQLDAQRYPAVLLHCRQVMPVADGVTVELAVTLRDRESLLPVPVKWRRSGNVLQADGEFSFRQSDLGLEPYSLLFGALRVADEIHARFRLVARQQQ